MPRERVIEVFPRSPLWDAIQEPEKALPSTDHISKNIANQALKFFDEFPQDFSFAPYEFQTLNLCTKKFIAQIPRWPVYEPEQIPNFHRWYLLKYCEPRSEIFRKPSSRFQLHTLKISASEASYKKIYSENSTMTCLEQRNPRIPKLWYQMLCNQLQK